MAKVEEVRKDPSIVITLSRREAAGVLALVASTHGADLGVDSLYYELDELFDDFLDKNYFPPKISIMKSEEVAAGKSLDLDFGKVK